MRGLSISPSVFVFVSLQIVNLAAERPPLARHASLRPYFPRLSDRRFSSSLRTLVSLSLFFLFPSFSFLPLYVDVAFLRAGRRWRRAFLRLSRAVCMHETVMTAQVATSVEGHSSSARARTKQRAATRPVRVSRPPCTVLPLCASLMGSQMQGQPRSVHTSLGRGTRSSSIIGIEDVSRA